MTLDLGAGLRRVRPDRRVGQLKPDLNDALIYLTAAKAGMAVLTVNRDEFDLIHQLAPQGRFIHF